MIGYSVDEIREKVKEIADGMDAKAQRVEELKASVLIDRGRLEELKNLHNIMIEAEKEEVEKKAKPKARVKK